MKSGDDDEKSEVEKGDSIQTLKSVEKPEYHIRVKLFNN